MYNLNMKELSYQELIEISGGSFWKYVGAVGSIAFGTYEVYTGVGAADGIKNIVSGGIAIIGGVMCIL